jgi:hypothetical protein
MANSIGPRIAVSTPSTTPPAAPSAPSATSPAVQPNAPLPNVSGMLAQASGSSVPTLVFEGPAALIAKKIRPIYPYPSPGTSPRVTFDPFSFRHIETQAVAMDGGWKFTVDTHHEANAHATLIVSLRLLDVKTREEVWLPVAAPFSGALPGADGTASNGLKISRNEFFLSIDDLNAWLSKEGGKKADGSPKLVFRPGDVVSVDARWNDVSGSSGGMSDARCGLIATPPLPTNATSIALMGSTAPIVKPGATVRASDIAAKPSRISFSLPKELIAQYPRLFAADATITSRAEEKIAVQAKSPAEWKKLTSTLLALTRRPASEQDAALAEILGEKGWRIGTDGPSPRARFKAGEKVWKSADGTEVDFAGMPKPREISQQLLDSVDGPEPLPGRMGSLSLSRMGGTLLTRSTQHADVLSLTRGPIAVEPQTGVAIEHSHELTFKPGVWSDPALASELRAFLETEKSIYNPLSVHSRAGVGLSPQVAESTVFDVRVLRYPFKLKHTSGAMLSVCCELLDLRSQTQDIEPPSTMGRSLAEKYEHWKTLMGGIDERANVINRGTFVEVGSRGERLDVEVELSTDEEGLRTVSEVIVVQNARLVIASADVDSDTEVPASRGKITALTATAARISDEALRRFFDRLSDDCSFAPPPSMHASTDGGHAAKRWEEGAPRAPAAALALKRWAFPSSEPTTLSGPGNVLEALNRVSEAAPEIRSVSFDGATTAVRLSSSGGRIVVSGDEKLDSSHPTNPKAVLIDVDGFAMRVPLNGDEGAPEIRDLLVSALEKVRGAKVETVKSQSADWDETQKKMVYFDVYHIQLKRR